LRKRCYQNPKWRAALIAGALSAAAVLAVPHPARAEGIFDFLFGGAQQKPPANVNSYAEPSAPGRVVPPPMGAESVRQGEGNGGRSITYCVRLCDGQHFPLAHVANATLVETCRAMCPASKTKVFSGSEIGGAVARDGARYADLDTAFIYRKQMVANCTCNGKDAFGLAPFDMTNDATLRPGDIVSTKDGFLAYSGTSGKSAGFTPVARSSVTAELMGPAHARLSRRAEPPAAADDPGTIMPPDAPSPVNVGANIRGQLDR
jgi:hypothetical protein